MPEAPAPAPLRLGFARGTAPSKWAARWQTATGTPLELVPVDVAFGRAARIDPESPSPGIDAIIERTMPGTRPAGADATGSADARHAIALYREALALVLPKNHELAEQARVSLDDLALVHLLDHAHHSTAWPDPQPWQDPAWKPDTVQAALDLVASGAGTILLPLPLARHLADKRDHAVLPLEEAGTTGAAGRSTTRGAADRESPAAELPKTIIWLTWSVDRDGDDVQQLAGVLRGRTARSSRGSTDSERNGQVGQAQHPDRQKPQPAAKKKTPKPGSRGAQLAAAQEKADRARAARRKAKKRRR